MKGVTRVYSRPWNLALAIVAAVAVWLLYAWSAQIIAFDHGRISFLNEPAFAVAAAVMAVLFGLLLPLEIAAIRLAAASATASGGTILGAVAGTASMTCCAPVLLPSLLSLLGFSGTSILGINGQLHRFWLPLATVGTLLLLYSLVSVAQALDARCRVVPQ